MGRCLSRVPGVVDVIPHRILLALAVQAARLHTAFAAATHDPDWRLSQPPASGGKGYSAMAAGAARITRRGDRDAGASAALDSFSCIGCNTAGTRNGLGDRNRDSERCTHPRRGGQIWRETAAHRDDGSPGGVGFLSVWCRSVFWLTRN